ncbi:SPOR domain-containing protein [Thiocapsa sp. UBA6158]|jgi:septal ring-binding cell division protein DamX|uniref:SPOR domain-containing protein n=1 Tax=Thiocapsa sp. UBA6158 TaxID=1947692 RepID=UPI0025FEBBB5|nr:SPOR domain-containing protein [Thiocapsa sp. UBA6158]
MSIVNAQAATQAETSLKALHSRVTRLLFAPTVDGQGVSAETLSELARQISAWILDARQVLTETKPSPPAADPDTETGRNGPARSAGLREESSAPALAEDLTRCAQQLTDAIDRLIQDPCAPDAAVALEHALTQARMRLPDTRAAPPPTGSWTREQSRQPDDVRPKRPITPWAAVRHVADDRAGGRTSGDTRGRLPATQAQCTPAGHKPGVEVHRLDASERAWWESQFSRLQRRADAAWMLGLAILAGLAGLAFWDSTRDQPRLAGTDPLGMVPAPDMPAQTTSTAARLERRMAEMEVEIVRLRAELEVALGASPGKAATATAQNTQGMEDADAGQGSGAVSPTEAERTAVILPTRDQDPAMADRVEKDATPPNRRESADTDVGPTEGAATEVVTALSTMITPRPLDPSADADVLADASLARRHAEATAKHSLQPVILQEPAYAVQLASLRDPAELRRFLDRSPLAPSRLFVESTETFDVVLLGFFRDAAAAEQALEALPDSLRRARPRVRRIGANQIFYSGFTD